MLSTAEWLTVLNILVAFLGVFVACFAFFEWRKLRTIREDVLHLKSEIAKDLYTNLRSTHRVMSSYGLRDPDQRIAQLESAARVNPLAFNVFNALGYAFLDKDDVPNAIDAFFQAIIHHPDDKAGYCDLAYGHLRNKNRELCLRYLRKAISVDATARDDILGDSRFADLHGALQVPLS
jgi:tetratricopeptide (TPR) repeat protein